MTERLTAPLALEAALEAALGAFLTQHSGLVREACGVEPSITDLREVVATAFYGHSVGKLQKLRGRAHVERLTGLLLDQFEAIADAARKTTGDGEPPPKREMH